MYHTVEKNTNTGYRKETDLVALNPPGLLALALACFLLLGCHQEG